MDLIKWGSTLKTYLKKLITPQNKAIKIVGGGKYFNHATPYYSKTRILKLVDFLKLEKALFVFIHTTKTLPSAFKNYFSEVYIDRSARSVIRTNLFIPFVKPTMLQTSIKYQGPIIWKSRDLNIKKHNSIKLFKYHLKMSLLSQYFDYNKSLVSLATHSQSRLNSFQTVKTLFCIVLPGHLDFISFLGCALFLAGDWPQITTPNERAYKY